MNSVALWMHLCTVVLFSALATEEFKTESENKSTEASQGAGRTGDYTGLSFTSSQPAIDDGLVLFPTENNTDLDFDMTSGEINQSDFDYLFLLWTPPPEIYMEEGLKDIENYHDLPDEDETKQFILSFSDEKQRQIIAKQLHYCPYTPLCSYKLDNLPDLSFGSSSCCSACSCFPNCTDYGTCCPDVLSVYDDELPCPAAKSCVPLALKSTPQFFSNELSVYGVDYCPDSSTVTLKAKCEQKYEHSDVSLVDATPVMHVSTKTVYRNVHCAVCNGLSVEKLDFFAPHLTCNTPLKVMAHSETELIRVINSGENCNIQFEYDYSKITQCTRQISTCNETGLWDHYDPLYVYACGRYSSMVERFGEVFQNVFCAMCNGYTDLPRLCMFASRQEISTMYTFSGLLNFALPSDRGAHDNRCGTGLYYDPNAVGVPEIKLQNITLQKVGLFLIINACQVICKLSGIK